MESKKKNYDNQKKNEKKNSLVNKQKIHLTLCMYFKNYFHFFNPNKYILISLYLKKIKNNDNNIVYSLDF